MTARPKDGSHRCDCGSKYWEGNKCHSCGQKWVPQPTYEPQKGHATRRAFGTGESVGQFKLADTVKGQDYGEPWVMWIPKGGKKDAWRGFCLLSDLVEFVPMT
jgi:hypothetical protein